MGAPNLDISVEPTEGGSVVYLPLAPRKAGGAANAQLSLRLQIASNESARVKLTSISISFPGTAVSGRTHSVDIDVEAHAMYAWYNGADKNLLIALPVPGVIAIDLCSQCIASSSSPSSMQEIPAPSSQVQRDTRGVSN